MKRKAEKSFPVKLLISLAVLILLIAVATEFYHRTEGWERFDSAYFSVITFTTIGYGDMVPQTDAGRIGTMVFSLLGIAVAFHFLVLFGGYIFEKKASE
ncbi:MAG: potassium channel family protein, partial [Candidatus Pacearchaeota archaeon]